MTDTNPITAVLATIALGVAIRVALRLFYGVRGPEPGDPVYVLLHSVSWVLLFAGLSVIVVFSFFGAAVPLVIGSHAALEMVMARRSQQRQSAWATVTRATQAQRPVEKALEGSASRFTGPVRRAVRRFTADLADGAPIDKAIARNPRAFPPHAQACAALAGDGGVPLASSAAAAAPFDAAYDPWRIGRRFSYSPGSRSRCSAWLRSS